eukprot:g58931.t1
MCRVSIFALYLLWSYLFHSSTVELSSLLTKMFCLRNQVLVPVNKCTGDGCHVITKKALYFALYFARPEPTCRVPLNSFFYNIGF